MHLHFAALIDPKLLCFIVHTSCERNYMPIFIRVDNPASSATLSYRAASDEKSSFLVLLSTRRPALSLATATTAPTSHLHFYVHVSCYQCLTFPFFSSQCVVWWAENTELWHALSTRAPPKTISSRVPNIFSITTVVSFEITTNFSASILFRSPLLSPLWF